MCMNLLTTSLTRMVSAKDSNKVPPLTEGSFDALVKTHIGGDPMNKDVVWTDLQPSIIVAALAKQGYSISENIVRELLKKKTFASASP